MVARIEIPWQDFSLRWGISFEENDGTWEAPGPVAYGAACGDSNTWYALEHHYDYPQPGVYVFVARDVTDPINLIISDFSLHASEITPMRA